MGLSAEVAAWAASGAAWLTGRPDGPPLGPPEGFVTRVRELGDRLGVDALGILVERAALAGLARGGDVSCGGATRLLPTADREHVAVTLARPDDWELLAALFTLPDPVEEGDWDRVAALVAATPALVLLDRGARVLGLPLSQLRERERHATETGVERQFVETRSPSSLDDLLVVDMSSLWAGPLAASILADAGARVVKVESTARPDGARSGPREVFDLLNAGKESVGLDLRAPDGVAALRRLVFQADIVVSSSRARALRGFAIEPTERHRPLWLSITGYGLRHDAVAFGDDAAVSGGLVVRDDRGPCFCLDAVADPLSGMVGAAAVLDALADGTGGVIDVAMARVAASFAGPTLPLPADLGVEPPRATRHRGVAPELT